MIPQQNIAYYIGDSYQSFLSTPLLSQGDVGSTLSGCGMLLSIGYNTATSQTKNKTKHLYSSID